MSDQEKSGELAEMNLFDHLEELRSVLISLIAVLIGSSLVLWFFSGFLMDFLLAGIPVEGIYFHAPAEAFMTRLKLSFIAGFLLSFPFILFRVWSFISPGLFAREKKVIFPLIILSTALFYIGVVFAYWIMIPVVLRFLLQFATDMLSPLLSVAEYFSFVGKLCFAFGIVFQLPLVIIFLTATGFISPGKLLRQWRWVIVIIFAVCALLTPPDPASQLLMAVPLVLLFFISVAVSFIFVRRKQKESKPLD
ncbi:MAG: twin-arginine translocase subunit TatC [Candidatus Latescibacteria bacterium]|nr:twin-arginine translocase subunit TatC [bacterium]MBD3425020.1 twin-arginine translocase subunit TatC [Candidatus Latescibacterota bacterium]